MLDWLLEIDTAVFLTLNRELANPVFDAIMPILTNQWVLRAVLVLVLAAVALFGGRRGRIVAVLAIVTVTISDQLSASVVKPLIERVRPCHVLGDVHLLVNCSQGYSFPSSHAANVCGQALLIGNFFPRWRWALWILAILVSYSRIAVGVHYPLDVIGGAAVGMLSGSLMICFNQLLLRQLSRFAVHPAGKP